MKMKNMLIGGMSLVLVACISVGGTLAYLSSQTGTATNTFTMNGLTLVVSETADAVGNGDYKQKRTNDKLSTAGAASVSTDKLAKNEGDGIAYTDILPGDHRKRQARRMLCVCLCGKLEWRSHHSKSGHGKLGTSYYCERKNPVPVC